MLILDQVSKWLVRTRLEPGESVPLIGDVLHVTHVRNIGAAFGFLPGWRLVLVTVSTLVIVGVLVYVARIRPKAIWVNISLGLIIAGALGNLIDRVVLARVTDFVDVVLINYPVFNVADSAVVVGVSMLIAWVLFGPEREDFEEADDSENEPL